MEGELFFGRRRKSWSVLTTMAPGQQTLRPWKLATSVDTLVAWAGDFARFFFLVQSRKRCLPPSFLPDGDPWPLQLQVCMPSTQRMTRSSASRGESCSE